MKRHGASIAVEQRANFIVTDGLGRWRACSAGAHCSPTIRPDFIPPRARRARHIFGAQVAISVLGELRGDGMLLFAFGAQMQIHGSRPGKCGAAERLSGQRVEIFGEARALDQRQAVATDPGG
jgi:hypothetical protein